MIFVLNNRTWMTIYTLTTDLELQNSCILKVQILNTNKIYYLYSVTFEMSWHVLNKHNFLWTTLSKMMQTLLSELQKISLASQSLGFNSINSIDSLAMFILKATFVFMVFPLNIIRLSSSLDLQQFLYLLSSWRK